MSLIACMLVASVANGQSPPRPPVLCIDSSLACNMVSPMPTEYLSSIPWHNAAGPWGPQTPIEFPAHPNLTRTVNVASVAQFNAAASVPGTLITITASWPGNTVAAINASDIEVVIPQGISVGAIEIGVWPRATPLSRIRIRGTVPGTHSGGRMGQYRDFEGVTDVIIDGVDLNGDSGFGGVETNTVFRTGARRFAVLNVRAIAPAYVWLGSASHAIISNSNFYHGAASGTIVGTTQGGWGIRNLRGPITILNTRIEGTRFVNIRTQASGSPDELLYVADSTLVALHESRTAWLWSNLGNGPWNGRGAIIENSDIYTYSAPTCWAGAQIQAINVGYSRIRNNRFFGGGGAVFTQAFLNAEALLGGSPPGDHVWSEGNTFQPLTGLPAWEGPGDPTLVPLPAGLVLNRAGDSPCPPPSWY